MSSIQLALVFLRDHPEQQVCWIDTVGDFPIKRLTELASGMSSCQYLDRFLYAKAETIGDVQRLVEEMQTSERVKLVVIDNIAAPFRLLDPHSISVADRTDAIRTVGLFLRHCMRKMNATLLCINHLTSSTSADDVKLALGDSWTAVVDLRIFFGHSSCCVIKNDWNLCIDGDQDICQCLFSILSKGVGNSVYATPALACYIQKDKVQLLYKKL